MNRREVIERCRMLRAKSTLAEKDLWKKLRNRKVDGLKFNRQHPIIYGNDDFDLKFFIADFYCAEKKLVIELDGGIHNYTTEYDKDRDEIIEGLGIKVIRFKNEEIDDVVKVIRDLRLTP